MSKKALVRFDVKKPEKQSSDFIAPLRCDGEVELRSLKNGKSSEYGLVIFTGRAVTSNDVFAKLVDSGAKIEAVDETLADFEFFVEHLSAFNVGNVLELQKSENSSRGFELKKTSYKAGKSKSRGLP